LAVGLGFIYSVLVYYLLQESVQHAIKALETICNFKHLKYLICKGFSDQKFHKSEIKISGTHLHQGLWNEQD